MKLYMAPRAPNPKRVCMFLAEKGIDTIEWIAVDLNAGAHRDQAFRARASRFSSSTTVVTSAKAGRFAAGLRRTIRSLV